MKMKPLAIIDGVRTPFCKAQGELASVHAADLGAAAVKAVLKRAGTQVDEVDEVVMGNVSCPADAANISRVVALKAGIPQDKIAHTVNRNCASGMESVLTAWQILETGRSKTIVAGGTESMSQIPLLVGPEATELFTKLAKARSFTQKLKVLARFRPRHLKPVPAVLLGLKDPVCGLNMGQTAELLAKEFGIDRMTQDEFALQSHQKAAAAQERCFLSGEIAPLGEVDADTCIRPRQTIQALQKLRPVFSADGTVTAGNSCPITDGAAAAVVTTAAHAAEKSLKPLGYVTAYAIAGCDPSRMGLGPVYATDKLLKATGLSLDDFDLIEINEAFAAQVLACLKAFESDEFAQKHLGRSSAIGSIPMDRLNINGGAIALGHPVGTTGTRMLITLLRALRDKGLRRGLATLCVGGGQGVAIVVETSLEYDSEHNRS